MPQVPGQVHGEGSGEVMAFIFIFALVLLVLPFFLERHRYTKFDLFVFFVLGIFAWIIFIEFCKWLEQ